MAGEAATAGEARCGMAGRGHRGTQRGIATAAKGSGRHEAVGRGTSGEPPRHAAVHKRPFINHGFCAQKWQVKSITAFVPWCNTWCFRCLR